MSERITGHTELVSLLAYPIRHSNSPAMQNEAFAYEGLDYAYLAFEVGMGDTEEEQEKELKDAITGLRAMKFVGSNISMPNKTRVGKYLDELDKASEMSGAVNTIVNKNGHLKGYTTDGIGYMQSLKDYGIDVIGKKMTIVGCGGAGTAIQIQAALDGVAELSIFNRKDEFWAPAEETVKKINEQTNCKAHLYDLADLDQLRKEIDSSYLLANATGLGMKPHVGETWLPDTSYLRPDLIVTDTVYAPKKTRFLEMADEVGCKWMNGDGMMLFQGAAAFKLWTGHDMPIEHMKEVLGIKYGE
ncbi:MAG: shikimate dehydrogenase [Lachnospiraceae bacterium]|nr:shikimate dehydrogenase [Lachnospiraceae bacterium]